MTRLPPAEIRVVHEASGRPIAAKARLASTFWTRLRGLLGTRELAEGEGLVIDPCNSVHTFGMRYPIDVVFATAEGEVVEVVRSLRPWRATRIVARARFVLELPAGAAASVRPGDRLVFERAA